MDRETSRDKVLIISNEKVQLDWLSNLVEQIEFANRRDVMPDYVIDYVIRRREQ